LRFVKATVQISVDNSGLQIEPYFSRLR